MANSVLLNSDGYFALEVRILNNDNSSQYLVITFNEDISDWQYTSNVAIANNVEKAFLLYHNVSTLIETTKKGYTTL